MGSKLFLAICHIFFFTHINPMCHHQQRVQQQQQQATHTPYYYNSRTHNQLTHTMCHNPTACTAAAASTAHTRYTHTGTHISYWCCSGEMHTPAYAARGSRCSLTILCYSLLAAVRIEGHSLTFFQTTAGSIFSHRGPTRSDGHVGPQSQKHHLFTPAATAVSVGLSLGEDLE